MGALPAVAPLFWESFQDNFRVNFRNSSVENFMEVSWDNFSLVFNFFFTEHRSTGQFDLSQMVWDDWINFNHGFNSCSGFNLVSICNVHGHSRRKPAKEDCANYDHNNRNVHNLPCS